METIKSLTKPPFANYDVVVYFGGGLFFVPFAYRYLVEPLGLRLPNFQVPLGERFLNEAVAALATLFIIYVIGHILAYTASQFIEKAADRVFGKVSSAIFVSCNATPATRNTFIRALIFDRFKKTRAENAIAPSIIRFLAHLPATPIYPIIYWMGFFGYYDTRIPKSTLHFASRKLLRCPEIAERVGLKTKWYKPLEYYVINRCPDAVPRMYNYLIIAGLFRTLSMVFLGALWAQLYFFIHWCFHGDWLVGPLMGAEKPAPAALEYVLLLFAYVFSLFSFLKFQRRYAEEAIFAFVFEPPSAHELKSNRFY